MSSLVRDMEGSYSLSLYSIPLIRFSLLVSRARTAATFDGFS